jgi:organic radical activating enzyme
MTLKISEVFESVQGEGTLSGTGALFIRLRGCNAVKEELGCAEWCDTFYAWKDVDTVSGPLVWTSDRLEEEVMATKLPLVVFTGGEPLLQHYDLEYWLDKTRVDFANKMIAFETNGTMKRDLPNKDKIWWTISPKPPKYKIKDGPISEIKIVVPNVDTEAWYAEHAHKFVEWFTLCQRIWVQPQDNDLDTASWIAKVLIPDQPFVRLNLQLHKILEVR